MALQKVAGEQNPADLVVKHLNVSSARRHLEGLGIWVGNGRARSAPNCSVLNQLSRRDQRRRRAAQLTRWGEKQIQESLRREGPHELPQKEKLKSILKEKLKCEWKDGKVAAARAAVVAEPSFSDSIQNQMEEPRWRKHDEGNKMEEARWRKQDKGNKI